MQLTTSVSITSAGLLRVEAGSAAGNGHRPTIVTVNIHAQIMAAYLESISTDWILLRADLLAKTETWMDAASPVNINNFQLVCQLSCGRRACDTAMYKRNDFVYTPESQCDVCR